MKRSNQYLARPVSALAASLLALCSVAFAQEAANKDPFAAGAAPAGADPFGGGPPAVRFDLDFPGGTIADLVEQINATLPNPPSIIMPDGADQAPVPPMRLQLITFSQLAMLIGDVTSRSATPILIEESVGEHWVVRVDGPPPEPRRLAIFPVDQLLEGRSVEDLLALVERAFAVAGRPASPQFHLHEETKVLMASLAEDEAAIVADLVAVLEKPKGESALERREKQKQIEAELAELKARYYEQSLQLATLEAKAAAEEDKTAAQRILVESEIMAAELRMLESEMSAYMELVTRMRARELGLDDEFQLPSPPRSSSRGGQTGPHRNPR